MRRAARHEANEPLRHEIKGPLRHAINAPPRRRIHALLRAFCFALLAGVLCTGLWQCARDTVIDQPAQLSVKLRLPEGPSLARFDSVDIEVVGPHDYIVRETVVPDEHGAWSALLPVSSGGPYTVRVFGWGAGFALAPDSSGHGVVAAGSSAGIELEPYQTANVDVRLHRTTATGLRVRGEPGVPQVTASWSPVPEATAYLLAWYADDGAETGASPPGSDTTATIEWDGAMRSAVFGGEPESVLFRVRPSFAHRDGCYGESLWVDLSMWLDPVSLDSIAPSMGETIAADTATVYLRFDRPIDTASLPDGVLWTREPAGDPVDYVCDPQPAGSLPPPSGANPSPGGPHPSPAAYRLRPADGELAMDATYRVRINERLVDALGRPFDADATLDGLQALEIDWRTAPYDPLHVVALEPACGDTGVVRTPQVAIALNRAAAVASVTSASVVFDDASGDPLAGELSMSATRDTIFWTPETALWYDSDYQVHVLPAVTDVRGKPLDQDSLTYPQCEPFECSFRTLAQPVGPRVEQIVSPAALDAVPRDARVQVLFSEAIDPASARHYDTFRLLRDGSVGVSGVITHDESGRIFTFAPSAPLELATRYEIVLRATLGGGTIGIMDFEGNPLDQDRTTAGYQDFTAWFTTESPPRVAEARFLPEDADTLVDVEPVVRLVFTRALDAATLTPEALQIRRGGASVPAAITTETDSVVRIAPLTPLAYRSTYSVRVDTLIAAQDGSLLDQSLSQAGRQPFERFFKTEPESLHPAVLAVSPADGDTLASIEAQILLDFSIAIDPATAPAAFLLTRTSGVGAPEAVPGDLVADSLHAVFTPDEPLAYFTHYEVSISSALLSRDGFPLDQDSLTAGLQPFVSGFRTDRERVPPHVADWWPRDGGVDVPVDAQIRLSFSEPMSRASVPSAFHLMSGGLDCPGTGTLDPSGISWQFAPEVPLEWLTSYAIVIDTTACDLAGNRLDQHPETEGADPFTSTFTTEPEDIPPHLDWSDPDDAATDVPIDVVVRAAFSEALDASSLGGGAFRVEDEAGDPLPGRLTQGPDSVLVWSAVTLPDSLPALLEYDATYTIIADTMLADLWGNHLDQDPVLAGAQACMRFFTTMGETLAPRVTDFLPGTEDVPLDAQLAVVFSEPMDTESLHGAGVVTFAEIDGPSLDFTLLTSASSDTMYVVPAELLTTNHEYALGVDTLAMDLHGNHLDQDEALAGRQPYAITFRTPYDMQAPYVAEVTPADHATHIAPSAWVRLRFSEPVIPSTVTNTSVYLTGPDGVVDLLAPPWLEEDSTLAVLAPVSLEEGATYEVHATDGVRDVADNNLDQNPDLPGDQHFYSEFTIGQSPVLAWDAPICEWSDTARVRVDATASLDPDPDDAIALAIWNWGDGTVDSLSGAGLLLGEHDYGMLDLRGCNGVDDDDDGWVDEQEGEGPSPCDESYRFTLRIEDLHGFADEATAGVSFCAFVATASDPLAGGAVAPGDTLRVWVSREVDPAGMDTSVVLTQLSDSSSVAIELALADSARAIVVAPSAPLAAGDYLLRILTSLQDVRGVRFDHDPALPGRQPFELPFVVPARVRP